MSNETTETPITVTYKGVVITYTESNRFGNNIAWSFELRGRARRATSLTSAKEAIDAAPQKNKKPFTRFTAFRHGSGYWRDNIKQGSMVEVEVTSIASAGGDDDIEVWAVDKNDKKSRGRFSLSVLVADSAANHVIISAVKDINAQITELETRREKLVGKLKPPVIPAEQIEDVK